MTLPITYADTETVHGTTDDAGGGGVSSWTSVINALTAFISPPGATLVAGYTTTATSGSTITLVYTSTTMQVLTGTHTQLVTMPTTSVASGAAWIISNQSTATTTVQSSGTNTITTIPAGGTAVFTAKVSTPTTAANWANTPSASGISVALGKILTASNSLTLAGTDGTTMTFPTSSDTVVTLAATQTMSGKTFTGYTETEYSIGTLTSSYTINLANGTMQHCTLTTATPCTFTMPTAAAGLSFIIAVRQPASGSATTATFTSVKWNAAGTPTLTATVGKADVFTFFCYDGTNWYGSANQGYTY